MTQEEIDNAAVDTFATAIKEKLAISRGKGISGWQDPKHCTNEEISQVFWAQVKKRSPLDVAVLSMMLNHRNSQILEGK